MKLLIELIVSVVLHPVAMVLTWINLAGRTDLTALQKIIWAIVCVFWGIGPILYVLVGGGSLW
jgi:hypothetical protein